MPDRTVVCWNGSKAADTALRWGALRELPRHGTLTVIAVVDPAGYFGDEESVDSEFDQEPQLDEAVTRLHEVAPDVEVRPVVLYGDPMDLLYAETGPTTLVVVGTKRRSSPRARFGWSFGARLAAAANGPVAIVPEESPDDPARLGIVVGVDGTAVGDNALAFAAREASTRGESLTIVHAWLEPLAWQPESVPDVDFIESIERSRRELLDDRVRRIAERHPGIQVDSLLVHGEPVIALREAARTATALVVGSRRLGSWKRAWLGSVSHGVILEMTGPTIVVGPEHGGEPAGASSDSRPRAD